MMNRAHKDQRYYELGCQAMGEVMEMSAKHRRYLNALEAVARAAQAVLDDVRIFYEDYRGRASPTLAVIQWDVLTTLRGEVAGLGPRKETNAKTGLVAQESVS